ncbi:MAG: hypothetical protein WA051_02500 [Minisyncoccia bacterium]
MRTTMLVLVTALLLGCRKDETLVSLYDSGLPTSPQAPVGVMQVFMNPHADSLKLGDTTTFVARAIPTRESAGFNRKIFWRSADTTIVSLTQVSDTSVRATGKKVGSAQIRGYASADSSKFATASLTVYTVAPSHSSPVQLVKFDGDSVIAVKVNESRQMPAPRCVMVNPSAPCELLWRSTDTLTLSVNATGRITGKKVGNAQVYVRVKADTTFVAVYPKPVQVK